MKTKKFILRWRGTSPDEEVEGETIADAMNNAGYGHGALGALDYYEEVKTKRPKGG